MEKASTNDFTNSISSDVSSIWEPTYKESCEHGTKYKSKDSGGAELP